MGNELLKVKGILANEGKTLESMRRNIMLGLFDVGRLIIDDEKKLRAFHDEIAHLTRLAHDRVVSDVLHTGKKEENAVEDYFGVFSNKGTSLAVDLEELLKFMYGDNESNSFKVSGFLKRSHDIICNQFMLHYRS